MRDVSRRVWCGLVSLFALVGALLVLSAPALAAAPLVSGSSVSHVGTTEATLGAQINPEGLPATYKIEYGTSEPYASSTEAEIPAAEEPVGVLAHLSGLTPHTEYHARFAATSALGIATGGELTFTTVSPGGPSALTLPDGREYELVSPAAGVQEVYVPEILVENLVSGSAVADVGTKKE